MVAGGGTAARSGWWHVPSKTRSPAIDTGLTIELSEAETARARGVRDEVERTWSLPFLWGHSSETVRRASS